MHKFHLRISILNREFSFTQFYAALPFLENRTKSYFVCWKQCFLLFSLIVGDAGVSLPDSAVWGF